MNKIPFEDGTLIKKGYVTIDNEQHDVEPAEYTGEVPLSAHNLNKMQDNIETAINEGDCVKRISIQGNSEQETSPSVDYPSEIESVGDINIFDYQNVVYLNAYIDTSSMSLQASTAERNHQTSYIECEPNTEYKITKKVGKSFRLGTTTNIPNIGVAINQTTANHTGTEMTITTGANDKYLCFTCFSTYDGDTGTYLDMYKTVVVKKTKGSIEIYNCNENLLPNEGVSQTINGVTFTVNNDGSITMNGTATANANFPIFGTSWDSVKKKIKLGSGMDLTLGKGTDNAIIYCRDAINNINVETQLNNVKVTNQLTLITYAFIQVPSGKTVSNETIYPMIVKGNYTLNTFPYYVACKIQTKVLYTQQPLRSIGDVRDKFTKKNGVWYEEHNIGQVILDGTHAATLGETLETVTRFYINNIINSISGSQCMSDCFMWYSSQNTNNKFNSVDIQAIHIRDNGKGMGIKIDKTVATTVDEFNAWLSENNVKVTYLLATPEFIECTPEQVEALSNIASAYGERMTNIICNDAIEPVIEIEKDAKETVQANNDIVISTLLKRVADLEAQLASTQNSEEGGA